MINEIKKGYIRKKERHVLGTETEHELYEVWAIQK